MPPCVNTAYCYLKIQMFYSTGFYLNYNYQKYKRKIIFTFGNAVLSLDWNEYINTQTCIFKVPGCAKPFSSPFEPLCLLFSLSHSVKSYMQ